MLGSKAHIGRQRAGLLADWLGASPDAPVASGDPLDDAGRHGRARYSVGACFDAAGLMWALVYEGTVVRANRAWAERFAHGEVTAALGRPVSEIFAPLEGGQHDGGESGAGVQRSGALERRCVAHDGRTFHALVRSAPVQSSLGEVTQLVIEPRMERRAGHIALRLVRKIARELLACESVDEALALVLERLCRDLGWDVGEAWLPDADGERLVLGASHVHRPEPRMNRFARRSAAFTFARGQGAPGRAWATGEEQWLPDVSVSSGRFSRAMLAAEAGLKACCATAVSGADGFEAVLVLLKRDVSEEDRLQFDALGAACSLLGMLFERLEAQESLHACRAIVESSSDFLGLIDRDLRWRMVSRAHGAELGCKPEALIGAPISKLFGERTTGERIRPHLERALAGETQRVQGWFELPRSGRRYLDCVYSPRRGRDGHVVEVVAATRDLTEIDRLRADLDESHALLRELVRRLETVREQELKTLAHDLHDELGQSAVVVQFGALALRDRLPARWRRLRDQADSLVTAAAEVVERVRNVSGRLRPPAIDILPLADLLEGELAQFSERTGIETDLVVGTARATGSDAAPSTVVYRIVQEALTNVVKHAGATCVEVRLEERDDRLVLVLADDGRGLDTSRCAVPGLSVLGMRERAAMIGGEVSVRPREDGHGTEVRLELPLERFVEEGA